VRELAEADGLVISEGTIYPLLTRLRKDQHVTTFWQESDSGPPRRVPSAVFLGWRLRDRRAESPS
jgi:PadR family transcriptional regulator PadR